MTCTSGGGCGGLGHPAAAPQLYPRAQDTQGASPSNSRLLKPPGSPQPAAKRLPLSMLGSAGTTWPVADDLRGVGPAPGILSLPQPPGRGPHDLFSPGGGVAIIWSPQTTVSVPTLTHAHLSSSLLPHVCVLSCLSRVQLFAIPCTVARQAPLSMGFSRQEYWSGLPSPPPGDLPKPMSLMSPALAGGFFTTSATWEALLHAQSPTHTPSSMSRPSPFSPAAWSLAG